MTDPLPTPKSLGLPRKFSAFRPGQYEAATGVVDAFATHRNVFLIQPPGAGKSLAYFTAARLLAKEWGDFGSRHRTLVLTGTKALQDQIAKDFSSMGAYVLKGADNYSCVAVAPGGEHEGVAEYGIGCGSKAPCRADHECSLKGDGCGYYDARREATSRRVVVANYALWMALGAYGQADALGKFDLLVCDEAHGAHNWLDNFLSARFGSVDWNLAGHPESVTPEGLERYVEPAIKRMRAAWKAEPPGEYRKTLEGVGKRLRKAQGLLKDRDNVVIGEDKGHHYKLRISPIWCASHAETLLFRSIPKVLCVSATMGPSTPKRLGVEGYAWQETTGGFASGRRPVIVVGEAPRVSWKMGARDTDDWMRLIVTASLTRRGREGLIHTRSYARAKQIQSAVAAALLATRACGNTEPHRAKIGPNFEEGVDFPHDLCRYILIPKIPFLDRRDPVTAARLASDPNYEWELIAETIMQMSGRGMRAEDDWCETLILDGAWGAVKREDKRLGLFPEWFRVAVRYVSQLPEPMVDPAKRKGLG